MHFLITAANAISSLNLIIYWEALFFTKFNQTSQKLNMSVFIDNAYNYNMYRITLFRKQNVPRKPHFHKYDVPQAHIQLSGPLKANRIPLTYNAAAKCVRL